ncbi:DUF3152 domain-containing protein [Streptomyces sp. NBC_01537]|uniref:DUF3152 domain-containing protein n=1 Tax=Streptomyces sp. NBC_01537 TaxID=2903896 RepID=UPI00386D9F57
MLVIVLPLVGVGTLLAARQQQNRLSAGVAAEAQAADKQSASATASATAGQAATGRPSSATPSASASVVARSGYGLASAGTTAPASSASATPSGTATAAASTAVPATGPGTFRTAQVTGTTAGAGTVHTYKVEVEKGIELPADQAAEAIEVILADTRGWTADGTDGFRLISSGTAEFTVKIATPGTVDKLCGAHAIKTYGNLNCKAGTTVVVNLRRWIEGSPQFDGPISDYRALIINYEVGLILGRGQVTCPGKGKLAPVMMQQIKGLKGCVANAWPYDSQGGYITGPSVS